MFQENLKNKAVKRWIHYFPQIHDSSLWALLYWIKSSSYQLCGPHRIVLLFFLLPYFPLTWPHPVGSLQWPYPPSSIPIDRTWVQGTVTSMTTSSYKEFPRLQSLALISLPDVLQQHRSKLEITLPSSQMLHMMCHSMTFKIRSQPTYPTSSTL